MFKKFRYLIVGISLAAAAFVPATVAVQAQQAQFDQKVLQNLGQASKTPFGADTSGIARRTPGQVIGQIIKVVLGFVGTIAFIVFLYGGFLWLTARGSDEQVKKAKQYLFNGLIGTIIIILAYSLTYYVTDVVYKATAG